jgi:O-antigen/teichoic acid export membrane protein
MKIPDKFAKSILGGSLILLIAFNLFNILNFLFQFSMARFLSIENYGVLTALFSLVYIFGIFSEPIQTTMVKYSSMEKESGKIKNLLYRSLKKAGFFSLFAFAAIVIIAIFLSSPLKIPFWLILLMGLMTFASFLAPVTRGIIQGKKQFGALGFNVLAEGAIKLVLGIALVLAGLNVYGAVIAALLAAAAAFIFSFIPLSGILRSKEKPMHAQGIYFYTLPVFLTLLSILAFFSIDIIIAKIVFDSQTAGFYAIASTLGKIVFLGTQPISKAMFPITSESAAGKGRNPAEIFMKALAILIILIALSWLVIYLFPDLLVRIFSGRYIPESASIVVYIALSFGILSVANLLLLYSLSISKEQDYRKLLAKSIIILVFPAIACLLLWIFSASLLQFSFALVVSSAIFLLGSILLLIRKR